MPHHEFCYGAAKLSSVTVCITMATIHCGLNDVYTVLLRKLILITRQNNAATDTDLDSLTPAICLISDEKQGCTKTPKTQKII